MTEFAAEPRPWHRIARLVAREFDDVMHGQEERRVAELADQPQLLGRAHGAPSAARRRESAACSPPRRTRPAHPAAWHSPGAVSSGYSVPRSSSSEKLQRRESARVSPIASGALRNSRAISAGGFRCRSALASSRRPAVVDRHMLADAGDDVLQRAALRRVIEHVVDGDQRNACARSAMSASRASRRASSPR